MTLTEIKKALKIRWVSIDSLSATAHNPKLHPQSQIDEIIKSIKQFGFIDPIIISSDGKIRAGHGRMEAAKQFGMAELPTICISHLSEADQIAYMLANNRVAKSEVDEILEAMALSDIRALSEETIIPGYSEKEIDDILNEYCSPKGNDIKNLARPSPEGEKIKPKKDSANAARAEKPLSYEIIFDTKEQQSMWYAFMSVLKDSYPDLEHNSARLARYIEENHSEAITGLFPETESGEIF